MNFPVSAETARWLAIPMGILFGYSGFFVARSENKLRPLS
jgi:hypothetical protein